MKKVFFSIFLLYLIQPISVYCERKTSFSGMFGGAGVAALFDHDYITGITLIDQTCSYNEKTTKKSITALEWHILFGYGYQFNNNLYISMIHESNFQTKAAHYLCDQHDYATGTFNVSRKFWAPSFGITVGYVVGNVNFGIRGGISTNKYKYEQNISKNNQAVNYDAAEGEYAMKVENGVVNKTLVETSPFIGVYVEKKFNDFAIGYMNVDYILKKQICANDATIHTKDKVTWIDNGQYTNRTQHKRSSCKVVIGIKHIF